MVAQIGDLKSALQRMTAVPCERQLLVHLGAVQRDETPLDVLPANGAPLRLTMFAKSAPRLSVTTTMLLERFPDPEV